MYKTHFVIHNIVITVNMNFLSIDAPFKNEVAVYFENKRKDHGCSSHHGCKNMGQM